MSKLFMYGTLRDGEPATHRLEGYRMFLVQGANSRNFPFLQKTEGGCYSAVGNVQPVSDADLVELDRYEGIDRGLYTREKLSVVNLRTGRKTKAWVYVGGPTLVYQPIDSGDWFSR